MTFIPPTVGNLQDEVASRIGVVLQDVGLFRLVVPVYSSIGDTPVILQGLRKGVKAVGLTPANALSLADTDIANLSVFGVERVMDEAELYGLERALAYFFRAMQRGQPEFSAQPMQGGWRMEQRNDVRVRISELKAVCDVPYREPSDPTVAVGAYGETYPTVSPGNLPVGVGPNFAGPVPPGDGWGAIGGGWGNGWGWGMGGWW
jgi:hypothetical protein